LWVARCRGLEAVEGKGLGRYGDLQDIAVGGNVGALRRDHVLVLHRVDGIHAVGMEGGDLTLAEGLDALEGDLDVLGGAAGVDNLHDVAVGGLVVDGTGTESVLACDGFLALCELEHVGAWVAGVHLLHIVVGGADGREVVHPDEVGTPLPAFLVGEEGCVGGHVDDVGIALEAGHDGGLAECGLEDILTLGHSDGFLLDVAGILAGKHLRALAAVGVVAGDILHEPVLVAIVMLVDEVDLEAGHLLPAIGELLAVFVVGAGTARAYDLHLGIAGADGADELLEALGIEGAPLLVADAYLLEVEGCGMAHVGTQLAPLGVGAAIGELDEVEGIVDVGLQVVDCHMAGGGILVRVLELARQSDAQYGQGLGANLLGEEEELVEAHAVGLIVVGEQTMGEGVVPAVLVEGAVLHLTDAVFPLVAGCQVGAFDDAAAGEAEHAGMEVLEVFHQVGTQTVPVVGGEEADMVEVDALLRLEVDAHEALGIGRGRLDGGCILLPLAALDGYALLGQHLVVGAYELDADLGVAGCAGIDGEVVVHAFLQANAEEAVVLKAGELVAMAGIGKCHIVRVAVEGGVGVVEGHLAEGVPAHQSLRELERAVLDELGIEASVGSEVDVLEEDAIHGGLDGSA